MAALEHISDPRMTSVEHGVLSAGTSPEIERLQVEAWRRMSPLDRLRAANALSRQVQALALQTSVIAILRRRNASVSSARRHQARLRSHGSTVP